MKFQIQKNIVALPDQLTHKVRPGGDEQLFAHLEPAKRGTVCCPHTGHKSARSVRIRIVERNDDARFSHILPAPVKCFPNARKPGIARNTGAP